MRQAEYPLLDSQFLERWSPRSFQSRPIEREKLMALFEAAHWAPSCFNEQPWRFIYAETEDGKNPFLEILAEKNQQWAKKAPVLVAVCAKKHFDKNGKPNDLAQFDSGAAWMSLCLQALKLGLHCHGMAGYSKEKVYSICKVDPEEYEPMCMVAIGYKDSPEQLSEDFCKSEQPNGRKSVSDIVFKNEIGNPV